MSPIDSEACRLDPVKFSYKIHTTADVLRLDLLHPVISGNKWFKLKGFLHIPQQEQKKRLLTFGGAYSNHILATAAAARWCGLQSVGLIRGEEAAKPSHTLQQASALGMQLFFLSREDYRSKKVPHGILDEATLIIPEGGYGIPGAVGAGDIMKLVNDEHYTHILAAVGTGTTLAGLVSASDDVTTVIGIPVLKGACSLTDEINALLPDGKKDHFSLRHEYHFGGYARHTPILLNFMNEWYERTGIPSDFVYTGKLFFALDDLARQSFFPEGSRILAIHSGGLQGNRSLPKGSLIF